MTQQEIYQNVMNSVQELRDLGISVEVNYTKPKANPPPQTTPDVQRAMIESLKHLNKNSKEYWTIKKALMGIRP